MKTLAFGITQYFTRRGATRPAPALFVSVVGVSLLLAGCNPAPADRSAADTAAAAAPVSASAPLVLQALTPLQGIDDLRFVPGADALRVAASEREGLLLLDAGGVRLARLPGSFTGVDVRAMVAGQRYLVASLDSTAQRAALVELDADGRRFGAVHSLPARDFGLAGLCLYADAVSNLYLFMLGEEGQGEQWLVATAAGIRAEPLRVRGLPLPPQAEYCQVDDASARLFVNEESVGLWAYPAHPEADVLRAPVDLRQPFGTMVGSVGAIAAVPGAVLVLDSATATLHRYQRNRADAARDWEPQAALPLSGLREPQRLAVRAPDSGADTDGKTESGLELLVQDDASGQWYTGRLAWQPQAPALPPVLPYVMALRQSEPVGRHGDAADDPAIWIHPTDPARSRVLGTNKKQGLLVYDLDGNLLQELAVGRLNNVDVRAGFRLGDQSVDVAVATHRDRNSISVFTIDRVSGELHQAGEVPTPFADIYGICLFQPPSGALYAFANDKDGTFIQYELNASGSAIAGREVRRFSVGSQPEGCVADDTQQRLFVGEEDVGLWSVDARADAGTELTSVLAVGEILHADVEGVGLYHGAEGTLLVVSSQGNDSYLVLDALPPFALRGAFRIGLNGALGIDGASETDGLEVTSANLGGPWSQGLLVVQDGRKRLPESTQNFKLVPWSAVSPVLSVDK